MDDLTRILRERREALMLQISNLSGQVGCIDWLLSEATRIKENDHGGIRRDEGVDAERHDQEQPGGS